MERKTSSGAAPKKQYSAPTLIDHGDAVEQTRGVWGGYFERVGTTESLDWPLPPPDDVHDGSVPGAGEV
jgi:hypothetical protein